MISVLHLTSWLPSGPDDPTGTFVREHIRAAQLHTTGAIVHVRWDDPGTTRRYSLVRSGDEPLPTWRLSLAKGPFRPVWFVVGLLRALEHARGVAGRPNIIHSHTLRTSVIAIALGAVCKRPVVLTEHATDLMPGGELLSTSQSLMARAAFTRADRVLPVGPALADAIRRRAPRARVEVLPNAVDTSIFRYASRRRLDSESLDVLVVGSLIARKRVDLAIRAIRLVRDRVPNVRLRIIGDGPSRPELALLVQSQRIGTNTEFLGVLDKKAVAAAMRSSALVLITSESETFSVVAAEALCVGTPVITTACGGPETFVDDQSGMVIPEPSALATAETIEHALQRRWDHSEISQHATAAFGLEAVGSQLNRIYAELK